MNMENIFVNEERELHIDNLGSNGEGVAHTPLTVFVAGALPGEDVLARITMVKKNYAVASLINIISKSPDRVEPECKYYEKCGGCQLQHLSYEAQLKMKRQQVEDALLRIGHLQCEVQPVIGMKEPWYYRNKMQFPVSDEHGVLEIGCYAVKTHGVVDAKECIIQEEGNNHVLAAVRLWMKLYQVSAYNEKLQTGLVRHVMARVTGNDVMVVLVVNGDKLPYKDELIDILQKMVPHFKSLFINVNKANTNIILGNESKLLFGAEKIQQELNGLKFNISPESFFQVNTKQAAVLYDLVKQFAHLTKKEKVVDVYCGTGTIALYLAKEARQVLGIEIVQQAIANAKENAKLNNFVNAVFVCGDGAIQLPQMLSSGVKPNVIVVDPPRAGCEERVLRTVMSSAPQRVIYVSCNPATLARDLAILSSDYAIENVQPVDMFPHTNHVETVVALVHKIYCS